jgi:S1-C subfamily serine protease
VLLCAFPVCTSAQASIPLSPVESNATGRVTETIVELLAVGPGPAGKSRECNATGFFVDDAGYLLTNAHVVDTFQKCREANGENEILAKFAGQMGKTVAAAVCQVIAVDKVHDLAILRVQLSPGQPPQPLRAFVSLDRREVDAGSRVNVTGHTGSAWEAVTQSGRIVRKETKQLAEKNPEKTSILIVNVPLELGASGSPVYHPETGGVVGIIEGREVRESVSSIAIPIRYAIELLDRFHVRWREAPSANAAHPDRSLNVDRPAHPVLR